MELRVLRYFLAVVREESVTRAAEALHITQPTLSRQLAQLEEELGATLFLRGKRKIGLTEAGILLRRRAEELIELADKTEQEISAPGELSGTIYIGSAETVAAEIFPKLLGEFHQAYPSVQYDLLSGNADQMKERLELGLMDIALLLEPVDLEQYEFLRLPDKDRWGVLLPAQDPLAGQESVSLADLGDTPLFISRRDSVQGELSGWFGKDFEQCNVMVTHNLIRNSARLVEHGLGYAVTIEGAVDIYDRSQVRFCPFTPELPVQAVLVWKKQRAVSPAVRAFLEMARKLVRPEK